MKQDTIELLSQQLAHWAREAIDQGRSPFRKVEAFPRLLTELGELSPPLIFWINKESFMAGGVLLFGTAEEEEERGRLCAQALGLRNFVTWTSKEIVFWECAAENNSRHKSIPLPDSGPDLPLRFRGALSKVMDELKILSVLGAVPQDRLSAHYLANLCLGSLRSARPEIEESYRVARGENRLGGNTASPEGLARVKGTLTLLRLLALTYHDRLATTVQPEGLERAMLFALDGLPPEVRFPLAEEEELPLPLEAAVRFHHLFRRLTQLNLKGDPRMSEILHLLLEQEGASLGGAPLPRAGALGGERTLLVNPDRLYPEAVDHLEVAPAPILAITALLRDIQGRPQARGQAFEPFSLQPPFAPSSIVGTLTDTAVPALEARKALSARLRSAWPSRRFSLPPQTPRWAWEFLHLLGIAAEGAEIELAIPGGWLAADYGNALFELLREQFTLRALSRTGETAQYLHLEKTVGQDVPTTFDGPAGSRRIDSEELREGHRSLLLLALELPESLFLLLENGTLSIREEAASIGQSRGIFLFSRSSLGRFLWSVVSDNQPLPRRKNLAEEVCRQGLPLPEVAVLEKLDLDGWQDGDRAPAAAAIDAVLLPLLGAEGDQRLPTAAGKRSASPRPAKKEKADESMTAKISAAVFVDGLPRFPEQYLYDSYRPQVEKYSFSGHLTAEGDFFGQHLLRDAAGETIEVEGAETARALLLASYGGAVPVALPVDRHLTESILDRYVADLKGLHQALVRQVHLQLSDAKEADRLVEEIWNSHPLPPWKEVEG